METKTFYAWLMQQRTQHTPIGDLARDAREDRDMPRAAKTLATYQKYLESEGCCTGAMDALNAAWNKWEEYKSSKGEK